MLHHDSADDIDERRDAASSPLFFGVFKGEHVPTWAEMADALERRRLEGASVLGFSAETLMDAARAALSVTRETMHRRALLGVRLVGILREVPCRWPDDPDYRAHAAQCAGVLEGLRSLAFELGLLD